MKYIHKDKKGYPSVPKHHLRNHREDVKKTSTDLRPVHSLEVRGELHTPAALPLRKESLVSPIARLGEMHSQPAYGGRDNSTLWCQSHYRLSYWRSSRTTQ